MTELTQRGKNIYDTIKAFLDSVGLSDDIDSFELSRLANAIDLNQRTSKAMNELQFDNIQKSFAQSQTYVTWKETNKLIHDLSEKYGLTPRGRKMLGITKEQAEESPLSAFL